MDIIEAKIPFFIKNDTLFTVKINGEALKETDSFLRIELYPKHSPIPELRHYGFWDIDLDQLSGTEIEITFNWEDRKLSFLNRFNKPVEARNISYEIDEHGYAAMHISTWQRNGNGEFAVTNTCNHTVYLERSIGDSSPMLKRVNIPVTSHCNLACVMCPRQKTEFKPEHCAPEIVEKIIEEFPYLVSVMLQRMGEPLLYPHLANIIKRFRAVAKPGATIGTTTNATLLNRERAIELCEAGLDFIFFSIDGATKEVYEKIRVGANFEQVIENITTMLEVAKQHRPEMRTMFNFVIQSDNLSQVPDIAELAANLGVNGMSYSYEKEPVSDHFNPFGAEALTKVFNEARSRIANRSLDIAIPPVSEVIGGHCCMLESACIMHDGTVLPCHAVAPGYCPPGKHCDFGSLATSSLREIWHSDEYTKFRDDVLHQKYPVSCQECFSLKYLVP